MCPFCPLRPLLDPLIELLPDGRLPVWIPYYGDIHVSFQLAATCGLYPEACAAAVVATGAAFRWTKEYYGKYHTAEGTKEIPKEGDAFTHCYWSGMITLQVGGNKAEKVTTRFEAYAGNDRFQKEYDIENNTRGRAFAQRVRPLGPFAERALRGYCRG